jgi:hypothetical protein
MKTHTLFINHAFDYFDSIEDSHPKKIEIMTPPSQIEAGRLIQSFLRLRSFEGYIFHNIFLAYNGYTCNADC